MSEKAPTLLSNDPILGGELQPQTQKILLELDEVSKRTVDATVEDQAIVLFSAGVDSSILGSLVGKNPRTKDCKLFAAGLRESKDISDITLRKGQVFFNNRLPILVGEIEKDQVLDAAKQVMQFAEISTLPQLEDCAAFYMMSEMLTQANSGKNSILISANGPDELFCGYDRFRRVVDANGFDAIEREIESSLVQAFDLQEKISLITQNLGVDVRQPFLRKDFVSFCKEKIPPQLKISYGNDMLRKRIWRAYGRMLGLSDEVVLKPKRAMQYSMGIHKIISSLLKQGKLRLDLK